MAGREQLDLRDQAAVDYWFRANSPEYVFLVAGTVGGILPNSQRPAEFIYDNLMIHATVVDAAHRFGAKKLLYLGSSCIYPREAEQPIAESSLLGGPLEPTNEAYAIAKIAGIKLCAAYNKQYGCNFISGMPTNLYGPNDNFDLETSHVLPALIRKFYEAKMRGDPQVTIWGTGTPRREFMHVQDLTDCCLFLMRSYDGEAHVNIGTGEDCSIRELAELIRDRIHPEAELVFDRSKPDGMPRKLLDVSELHRLGWRHRIALPEGIARTCDWFSEHYDEVLAAERSRTGLERTERLAGRARFLRGSVGEGAASIDDPGRIAALRTTIRGKPALESWYRECYETFADAVERSAGNGPVVELGSGAGFLKERLPEVITSDVVAYEGVERVIDAKALPFEDSAVRGHRDAQRLPPHRQRRRLPARGRALPDPWRPPVPGGSARRLDQPADPVARTPRALRRGDARVALRIHGSSRVGERGPRLDGLRARSRATRAGVPGPRARPLPAALAPALLPGRRPEELVAAAGPGVRGGDGARSCAHAAESPVRELRRRRAGASTLEPSELDA